MLVSLNVCNNGASFIIRPSFEFPTVLTCTHTAGGSVLFPSEEVLLRPHHRQHTDLFLSNEASEAPQVISIAPPILISKLMKIERNIILLGTQDCHSTTSS